MSDRPVAFESAADFDRMKRVVLAYDRDMAEMRQQVAVLRGMVAQYGQTYTQTYVRLTGDKDTEGLYPGVFTYPDPNPRPPFSPSTNVTKWYDGYDELNEDDGFKALCRVRPAVEGGTLDFLDTDDPNHPDVVRYDGRVIGARDAKSVDPDADRSPSDGFPVVVTNDPGSAVIHIFKYTCLPGGGLLRQTLTVRIGPKGSEVIADSSCTFTSTVDDIITLKVMFAGTATPGPAVITYAWDFGGAGTVTSGGGTATPVYTYTAAGTYAVVLTVTYGDGVEVTHTAYVTVS
jgi:hypothetical protein